MGTARPRNVLSRALLAGLVLSAPARAATIIVPDDNPSLPNAVQSSGPGDLIQVRPGNYPEAVTIGAGHDNLTIEALGERPVFPPANRKDGFRVRGSNGVTIRGFRFDHRKTPVRLDDCTGCVVDDIQATGCREGIRIKRGGSNSVLGSAFTGTTRGRGIRVDRSPGTTLGANVIIGAARGDGILLGTADGAQIGGNTITAHKRGIVVKRSLNATVFGNITNGNGREGVIITDSGGLTISGNTSDNNITYGFRVDDSPPIAAIADLTGAGNTATGNGTADFLVD